MDRCKGVRTRMLITGRPAIAKEVGRQTTAPEHSLCVTNTVAPVGTTVLQLHPYDRQIEAFILSPGELVKGHSRFAALTRENRSRADRSEWSVQCLIAQSRTDVNLGPALIPSAIDLVPKLDHAHQPISLEDGNPART